MATKPNTSSAEMTRLQVAEVLISAMLPLAENHVRRRYAVVGSSEMEDWKRCENLIRGAQRFLGLKPEGVFIPDEEEKSVCYLSGGEPDGNCDCYACGKANERDGTGMSDARIDEERMRR